MVMSRLAYLLLTGGHARHSGHPSLDCLAVVLVANGGSQPVRSRAACHSCRQATDANGAT